MLHCGYDSFSIDASGDGGGDIICEKPGEIIVIQCKWKIRGAISREPFEEAREARMLYGAHRAIVATNQRFSKNAQTYCEQLRANGIPVDGWDISNLQEYEQDIALEWLPSITLRSYQKEAIEEINKSLRSSKRALLFLATGLGKTVVAGALIKQIYQNNRDAKILVLAHLNELVEQLQRSMWNDIPLNVPSQIIGGGSNPDDIPGLTVGTQLTAKNYIEAGYRPDFLVIDECHHVGEDNTYAQIIDAVGDIEILGVTATPWRGDEFNIENYFGKVSYSCGIEKGMKGEYLSPVDYRLFSDNIDWDAVPEISVKNYSIKELNKKLFINSRDQTIIEELVKVWMELPNPKAIIFCQSIAHTERLHREIRKYDRWRNSEIIHSGMGPSKRRLALTKFRREDCPLLLAVDILNEGVDVPNVNLVCFARVTHSRKIFVQQLGRGLRLAKDKEKVIVLDFAADIRRMAAIMNLKAQVQKDDIENIDYHNKIEFEDANVESLLNEWILDAANLETAHDETVLNFPPMETHF
jgi:superfamily II DNA or RNA helicase